jgi:hypothetical protein
MSEKMNNLSDQNITTASPEDFKVETIKDTEVDSNKIDAIEEHKQNIKAALWPVVNKLDAAIIGNNQDDFIKNLPNLGLIITEMRSANMISSVEENAFIDSQMNQIVYLRGGDASDCLGQLISILNKNLS